MAGMGILQLALMLAQGGWVCLGLIVACSVMTNYTGKLLIQCCYVGDVRTYKSYAAIGEAAFGVVGKGVVWFFENLCLFAVSTLFFDSRQSQS
jgi:hypothetical protein